jgi:hypothetical protein
MIVFSRELFVCRCSTDVPTDDPNASPLARSLRFVVGAEADLLRLDREHHNDDHVADFRARLARGEHWVLGLAGERVMTYTWDHTRELGDYPYLPGCAFHLAKGTAYGYDAWTTPDERGGGLRRRAFLEELRVLRDLGYAWQAHIFVKHHIEPAKRSLARVGIVIEPLWRVTLQRDRTLAAEKLAENAEATAWPAFKPAS